MAIECTSANLADLAACFACDDTRKQLAMQTYLLAVIAGVDPDPEALIEASKAFAQNTRQLLQMQVYLLCALANAEGA